MLEDPLVLALAEACSLNPDYVMMCNMVEGRYKAADIPKESELKQVEGIREELRVVQMSSGTGGGGLCACRRARSHDGGFAYGAPLC